MIRFTVLTAILAMVVPGSHSHPAVFLRDTDGSNAGEAAHVPPDTCYGFPNALASWRECQYHNEFRQPSVDDILSSSENICRNKDQIQLCMTAKYRQCDTLQTVENMLNTTFGFCENNQIPSDMREFLTSNSGTVLSNDCIQLVLEEARGHCGREKIPKFNEFGLKLSSNFIQAFFTWHVACFKATETLDQTVDECGGLTKRTVYGIMVLAIVPSNGLGMNLYQQSTELIQSNVQEPLALAQEQFYRSLVPDFLRK